MRELVMKDVKVVWLDLGEDLDLLDFAEGVVCKGWGEELEDLVRSGGIGMSLYFFLLEHARDELGDFRGSNFAGCRSGVGWSSAFSGGSLAVA